MNLIKHSASRPSQEHTLFQGWLDTNIRDSTSASASESASWTRRWAVVHSTRPFSADTISLSVFASVDVSVAPLCTLMLDKRTQITPDQHHTFSIGSHIFRCPSLSLA